MLTIRLTCSGVSGDPDGKVELVAAERSGGVEGRSLAMLDVRVQRGYIRYEY